MTSKDLLTVPVIGVPNTEQAITSSTHQMSRFKELQGCNWTWKIVEDNLSKRPMEREMKFHHSTQGLYHSVLEIGEVIKLKQIVCIQRQITCKKSDNFKTMSILRSNVCSIVLQCFNAMVSLKGGEKQHSNRHYKEGCMEWGGGRGKGRWIYILKYHFSL